MVPVKRVAGEEFKCGFESELACALSGFPGSATRSDAIAAIKNGKFLTRNLYVPSTLAYMENTRFAVSQFQICSSAMWI